MATIRKCPRVDASEDAERDSATVGVLAQVAEAWRLTGRGAPSHGRAAALGRRHAGLDRARAEQANEPGVQWPITCLSGASS